MIRYITVLLILTSFISCVKTYSPRKISQVTIQEFKRDSTSIRAILSINKKEMYYAGSRGDIVQTLDGGITWKEQNIKYSDSLKPHFRSLAYNGSSLFAMSIANPALLYKIDGDKISLVHKEEHEKIFYDSMKFFDATHGIVMGDATDTCLSILLTEDGGSTWEKIPCENLPPAFEGEAAFAASNSNIKTLGNTVWIATGGTKARVFKSLDKGRTWNVYNTPMIQGKATEGIFSVDFYNENNGVIVGGDYTDPETNTANKAITKDGGQTWDLVAVGKSPNYKSCVKYVPNTNGKEIVAVGKTGVSFSNDGGITWTDISNQDFYAIQFVDGNTAWLSGNNKIGKLILE